MTGESSFRDASVGVDAIESLPNSKRVPTETPAANINQMEAMEEEEAREVADDDELHISKARSIALVITLTGASFLNVLSTQAVVIILPVIRNTINIPESRSQWIVSAYSLTFGCSLLLWGRIGDVYGTRPIFLLGTALTTVSNVANPFVRNEVAFDFFRGLAGIGAAASVPTAIGILGTTFTTGKRRNYAFATYSAGSALGGAVGNLLSGFISAYASWKWVFGVLAIFAAIITIAGFFLIPPPPAEKHTSHLRRLVKSIDWLGGFIITASLLALLFALTEGNVVGWNAVYIPILITIAGLLMATFVAWQWYQEYHTRRAPLIRISFFLNWRFTTSVFIMGMFFGDYNAFVVFATYFWQDYQNLSTLQTTLRFIPAGVTGTLVAFVMSKLISRMQTCVLLVGANLAVAISCLLLAIPIPPQTTYFATGLPAMILSVIGADIVWPCLTLFTSVSMPISDQAVGGAIINASGQLGRAIGLAITTALQTKVTAHQRNNLGSDSGGIIPWDEPSLAGLRAGNWYSFSMQLVSTGLTIVAFRGTGIVGKIQTAPGPVADSQGKG